MDAWMEERLCIVVGLGKGGDKEVVIDTCETQVGYFGY